MNEPRFKMFLLYMIDLHNLHIDNRVDLVANPLNEKREEAIQNQKTKSFVIDDNLDVNESLERVMTTMSEKLKITDENTDKKEKEDSKVDERFEDCYSESNGELKCNFCPGTYKREGHLRNHLDTKHKKTFKILCSCGKLFSDSTRLSRHKKSCK